MAHIIRIVKGRKLKSKWKHYLQEKKNGLHADEDESGVGSSKGKKSGRKRLFTTFESEVRTPNTIRGVARESFLGFVGGVLLTYALFLFFHIGVNISTWTSTYTCALVGIILSLGLAFSSNIRCYVLLLLPALFSKQGRQALLTYALFLAFTGPGRNTMHNMGVLSDSLACGQEMVRRTLKQIMDMTKAPDKSIKETTHKVMKAVQKMEETMRTFVVKIKRLIISVLNVIKMVTKWLGSIVNFCNKKIGTPFQRCMKVFDEAIADCKAKLGVVDFLCHVVHIMKALCHSVKCLDFICLYTEFVSDEVIGAVKKKLRAFHLRMKDLLYVSIELNHSYKVETTATNATKQVGTTILQKLSKKMEKLQTIFSFFGFVFSLFFLFLFIKVYYYRYKYFSSDRYDNVYISRYIVELDVQRAQMNRETVLPLEPREKNFYGKATSIRLLKNEKSRIAESLFLLGLTSFKIITFLVVDYSLFWILMIVYEAGRNALDGAEETKIIIHVEGKGILADFYRKLGKTLQVPENLHVNRHRCLPNPIQPDIRRYIQIGFLVTLCWLLTMTEAYGLRLRHVVMSYYYPDRARERAIWLYNHIIRSRCSFVRYARRELRKKFGGVSPLGEKVTMSQRLFTDFPVLGSVFGRIRENKCLICEELKKGSDSLKRCRTPDCRGRYCLDCFALLNNTCTICQHPINYGDISDISEEIDSSEEEFYERKRKESFGSESGSDDIEEREKFLTFKEMETRESFRDVEENRQPDYAKLGDLYSDKAALQKRLKAVIERHLENIERERNRESEMKESEYQCVRLRLKDVISKLKSKKMEQIRNKKSEIKQKFSEKIENLRSLKEKKSKESEILLADPSEEVRCKPTKSRVAFKLDVDVEEIPLRTSQSHYARLKNELKAKIESLKRRKHLKYKRSRSLIGGGSLA